ncbi:MAG: HAD family hydrolase [Solirubrobacteraceae bacterium]
MVTHVVWDWNGTLYDDFHVVVNAAARACASAGGPPIDAAAYRAHFTRPVQRFYAGVLGRPVVEEEWRALNDLYLAAYREQQAQASLATDARAALAAVAAAGHTQSLLSMWDHDDLVALVRQLGIDNAFVRVDGLRTREGGGKTVHLLRHLEAIAPAIDGEILMVGDTTDDATAAQAARIRCVLMEDGPHPREALTACNVPLAGSLVHALELGGALTAERSRA